MDEKVLIKSEINQKAKQILCSIPIMFFVSSMLFLFYLLNTKTSESSYANALEAGLRNGSRYDGYLTLFIIACSLLLISIITFIVYYAFSKCELSITEKNVKGKTFFGKEVVLPLYMVSAYSTRKFMSTIAVATSSGVTKFALVKNYAEIGSVLSQKINERQENTAHQATTSAPTSQPSAMDDLKKLKDLLDAGIITQEEFDAKKKQLLGL